ncbi:ATP-binding protein [Pseudoxanthomonas sp.]|uniref:ATP-binding protein n=1 Tax=Pseudoxanthomonas sp. TaxID=1871049 RepID=UPI0028C3A03A|nr:ATP-binding protein [Pseudoxanthomonas sp.]
MAAYGSPFFFELSSLAFDGQTEELRVAASNEELVALMEGLESDRVERKQGWSADIADKVRQAVCAFANDLPGYGQPGYIFIGVQDNGTPAGIRVDDDLLLNIAHIKDDGKILPPPSITVESRNLRGVDVAVVTVQPADAPPVRYSGRVWVRTGPRRALATAQDERILAEKRRHNDRSFDVRPIYNARLEDLNRAKFEGEYLPQAFAHDVLDANGRTYEQRLASLGFISSVDDPVPTMTGILTIGKAPRDMVPGGYIQFLRVEGTEWGGAVLDEQDIDGTIDQILTQLDNKIRAHNTTGVVFTGGDTREHRVSKYPLSAIQQIARNAVMHRNYEGTHAPVRIYWFDDRIEVHSPGGPYGMVNLENFGRPGVTDYRNPALAASLRTMGFVQKFGFGIAEARRSMAENGNPEIEFEVNAGAVLFILRAHQ